MRKYFYIENSQVKGPVSKVELELMDLSPDTLIWYYGLDGWMHLKDTEDFGKVQIVPPPLPAEREKNEKKHIHKRKPLHISKKAILMSLVAVAAIAFVTLCILTPSREERLHRKIAESAYDDPSVDFDFYVDKYYRDLEYFGIISVRPESVTIKFADLDKMVDTKETEGICFGINHDDKIEIYINRSSWEKFTKPMKYWLMYHELTHDILNVEDLPDTEENKGKLMYPYVSKYFTMDTGTVMTMDYFIEHFHSFIDEYTSEEAKNNVSKFLNVN